MGEFSKELEWKNHMPFFTNLNKDMDILRNISRDVRDFNKLPYYYYELDNISTHYSCYIDDEIKERLGTVSEIITTTKYNRFINNKMDKEEYAKFYNDVLEAITELKSIHAEISKNLHDNELFPKIKKKKKKDISRSLVD